MVNIEYSNFWGWLGLRGITYVYRVSILPASEYKIYQSFYDPYPTQRTGKSVAYIRRLISWAVSLHVLDETHASACTCLLHNQQCSTFTVCTRLLHSPATCMASPSTTSCEYNPILKVVSEDIYITGAKSSIKIQGVHRPHHH